MDAVSVVLIAVGLAMDAFAVALCKGTASRRGVTLRGMFIVGLWFGSFQAIMPVIGYLLGSSFHEMISGVDYWVASILLMIIGANMAREALSGDEDAVDDDIGARAMLPLAVATSIDALAVGVSLSMEGSGIIVPAMVIGLITMGLSMAGVWIGGRFGDRFGNRAELVGGAILVLMGLRILSDGLGLL